MNKLLKSVRRTAQSAVVTMLLVGIATPACTTSHGLSPAALANTPTLLEASSVRQQNDQAPQVPSLVFLDESHKSVLVEPDDEACSAALYIEDPLASGYVPVSEGLWQICNEQLMACVPACINALPARKRKDKALHAECARECNKKYYVCMQLAGLAKAFDALDKAWSWIKDNKAQIVGTIVIVGGVAYIVSTGGTGALILIPLGV